MSGDQANDPTSVWCPTCGARPGGLCITSSGRLKPTCHPPRVRRASGETRREKGAEPRYRTVPQRTRKAVMLRSGGWCEVCPVLDPGAPQHRGEQMHHRRMRSQGGTDDADNVVWACRRGHGLIHDRPERAYKVGLLVRAGQAG